MKRPQNPQDFERELRRTSDDHTLGPIADSYGQPFSRRVRPHGAIKSLSYLDPSFTESRTFGGLF